MANINNGICETKCNTKKCDWDGGDCQTTEKSYNNLLNPTQPFTGVVLYTTFVFNKEFGSVERQVPAHVPYMIDKTLMSELQDRFVIHTFLFCNIQKQRTSFCKRIWVCLITVFKYFVSPKEKLGADI